MHCGADANEYYYFRTLLQDDGGDGKERRQTCFCVEVRMDPTSTPGSENLNRDELRVRQFKFPLQTFLFLALARHSPAASDSRLGELQKR